jgi:hypothetical protein
MDTSRKLRALNEFSLSQAIRGGHQNKTLLCRILNMIEDAYHLDASGAKLLVDPIHTNHTVQVSS